jgi:hypothetical protein
MGLARGSGAIVTLQGLSVVYVNDSLEEGNKKFCWQDR